jgi:hypothetical protein
MPHREGYPGRRDGFIGHRDETPEEPLALLRKARRILIMSTIHAERWNIPPLMLEGYKFAYLNACEAFAITKNDPPPEPDPIDGFTVYWDKSRRFNELLCAFYNVDIDRNGRFDIDEIRRLMQSPVTKKDIEQWREFLLNIVRANAVRYNMPQEWVETVRARMYEHSAPDKDASVQKTFFLFYTQN